MNIAEKIYETVKDMPEQGAAEVLHLAEKLKTKSSGHVENGDDFFSLAGIWQGRDLTEESLRDVAWRDNALLRAQPQAQDT